MNPEVGLKQKMKSGVREERRGWQVGGKGRLNHSAGVRSLHPISLQRAHGKRRKTPKRVSRACTAGQAAHEEELLSGIGSAEVSQAFHARCAHTGSVPSGESQEADPRVRGGSEHRSCPALPTLMHTRGPRILSEPLVFRWLGADSSTSQAGHSPSGGSSELPKLM